MNQVTQKLAKYFSEMYEGLHDHTKGYIPHTFVAQYVCSLAYDAFIREGIVVSSEQLPVEEKKELVDECRLSGEFFTNETLIERCKILYVIKTINSNT